MKSKSKVALLASVLAVAGGGASIAAAAGGSSGSAGPGATTAGSAATGTATVTVTRPDGKTHTRPAREVRCTLLNGAYVLRGVSHRGRRVGAETLTVPGYHEAGSYTGTVNAVLHGPFLQLHATRQVPVTMTDSGGSVTVSRTLPGRLHPRLRGKTVSETVAWTCTA
ncbi:MAG: hypothetical protein ACLP01_18100 [Solirubrobacteraceae bacterium]